MSTPIELGRVARLQVAPEVPKRPGPEHQLYDPAPLRQVEQLLLSDRGVAGLDAREQQVLDVHHQDHPRSRFRGGNAISVGFTSHYSEMRARFGPRLVDGCAAENILVEATSRVALDEASTWIVLEDAQGRRWNMGQAVVAEPCLPFARWALGLDAEAAEIREALQFLRRGTRGFYLGLGEGAEPFTVRVGDRLLASREPIS